MPPQFLFDGARGRRKWSQRARTLLLAFQMFEDSLCGSCAQSGFHALDVANTREFSVDVVTCLGCNVREVHQENNPKPSKGLKVFVVNRMGQQAAGI